MAEQHAPCQPWQLPACTPPEPLSVANATRVLVLVPHPDDEVLGCGGLLAELAQQGTPTRVILVTNGDGAGGLPAGADIVRQAEFAQAIATLGSTLDHDCWQLPDGGLANATELPTRIAEEINRFQPSLVVAPWPGDMHPDHAVLGRHLGEWHQRQPFPQGLLFFEVWSPLPATHVMDISTHWPCKQAALDCHATALACGNYQRAMAGLASYRSLLSGHMAQEGHFTEAYYGCDIRLSDAQVQAAMAAPDYRLATPDDGACVSALFERVFETPLPAHWWQWKYASQRFPGSVAYHAVHGLIGFYGAQGRSGRWQGNVVEVCQQGDVMVAKGHRFATRQRGVFATLSRTFLTQLVGPERPYALSFGFPTPRAMKLGEHLGLYQAADYLQQHVWDIQRRWLGVGTRYELSQVDHGTNWQWLDQLTALPTERDDLFTLEKHPKQWAWRFAQHPEKTYHLLRIYRFGSLCAAAVVHPHEQGELEVMDLALATPSHSERLWRALSHVAHQLHCSALMVWGTQTALDCFPQGERSGAGQLALPGPNLEAPLATEVKGRCWLLGGDTDFR